MNKVNVGVIGSGAMGSGIAQVAAMTGHNVILHDSSKGALQKSKSNLESILKKLVEKQKLAEQSAKEIFQRIEFTEDLKPFSGCTMVIEAIFENLEVKQKVFSDLEKSVSDNCILATNTSSLSITSIASACAKPERVVGIHFFNPPPLMPLVEIIPGLATHEDKLSDSKKIIDSWGKTTVVAKDTPGFIVNRIARPYYGEAIRIYEEGIADLPAGQAGFATIDYAMKEIGKFKMGPFELMDFIGNDVNYAVTKTVWEQMFFDSRYKPSITQKRLFEANTFGRKSGKGYYDYSENEKMPEPKKDNALAENIFIRILSMLINEAVDALYLNIASKEDIETAMIKGVNYPKGLLHWADEIGLGKIYSCLKNLQEEYGEERYRPSVLIKRMISANKNFF